MLYRHKKQALALGLLFCGTLIPAIKANHASEGLKSFIKQSIVKDDEKLLFEAATHLSIAMAITQGMASYGLDAAIIGNGNCPEEVLFSVASEWLGELNAYEPLKNYVDELVGHLETIRQSLNTRLSYEDTPGDEIIFTEDMSLESLDDVTKMRLILSEVEASLPAIRFLGTLLQENEEYFTLCATCKAYSEYYAQELIIPTQDEKELMAWIQQLRRTIELRGFIEQAQGGWFGTKAKPYHAFVSTLDKSIKRLKDVVDRTHALQVRYGTGNYQLKIFATNLLAALNDIRMIIVSDETYKKE